MELKGTVVNRTFHSIKAGSVEMCLYSFHGRLIFLETLLYNFSKNIIKDM